MHSLSILNISKKQLCFIKTWLIVIITIIMIKV